MAPVSVEIRPARTKPADDEIEFIGNVENLLDNPAIKLGCGESNPYNP